MRRRLVVAPAFRSASIAAALIACPLVNAASVQAIFSAENALYGAGYNIGQADGWIDEQLRSAIRQYQTDRSGLDVTGELDSQTLAALGISGSQPELVGGNAVSSREAARTELGLALASAAKPAPSPEPAQPVATPEPVVEPEPQPEPEPQIIAEQIEEPEQKVAEQTVQKQQKPTLAAVNASESKPEPKPAPEPVQSSEPEFEPTSQPIVIGSVSRDSREANEPDFAMETATQTSLEATAVPEKPTAHGDQDPTNAGADSAPPRAETSGNVLTRMFDFLFGWMV